MKQKKLLILGACLGLTTLSLTSCGSSSDKLIVATNATFEPFEYKDGTTGEFAGIDIDFAKLFGEKYNYEVSITDIDFDSIVPSVQTGKADLGIAGMTKTDERAKIVDFTDAYYSASQVVIVKNDSALASATTLDSILDCLKGKTIGCQSGTTGESYIKGSEELEYSGIESSTCRALQSGYLACESLSNGQIDAVIIDAAPANLYVKNYTNLKVLPVTLTTEEYAIAVKKGNTELLSKLNEFIAEIKNNGKLEEIIAKYNETNN